MHVRAVHEYHRDQEERVIPLSQAIATRRERMADIFAVGNVFEAHRNAQAKLVREGIAQGTIRPCDVDALMTLIRSVTDGLLIQRVVTGVPYELMSSGGSTFFNH